jgi:hypothetical protein
MAAINAILAKAAEYSMDQYASKVIEKLLKIGGDEFLERYLKAVTSRSSVTNPRMPLIDSKAPHSLGFFMLLTLASLLRSVRQLSYPVDSRQCQSAPQRDRRR